MTTYVKSLSKRNEVEDKEKILPVGYLGQTMIHHGEDFEPDSEFGNCLISAYMATVTGIILTGCRHGQSKRENSTIPGDVCDNRYEWMA